MQFDRQKTKQLAVTGMLAAVAYLLVLVTRFPIFPAAPFLTYEPKDAVIAIGGFLYGPVTSLLLALLVSFLEMVTVSTTAWIGFVMNFLSSAAFALPAALFYRCNRKLSGAVIGLSGGCVTMTAVMVLWNWLLTPLYMHVDRSLIVGMLFPVFLPFNLLKSVLNAGFAMLLYKPAVKALRAARMLPEEKGAASLHKKKSLLVLGFSLAVIAAVITLMLLIWRGIF
ncbi:MAG: ECF transporter S component [Clostridia bacterium]|nr:ECF transporter S component [Clostridia bacterium]